MILTTQIEFNLIINDINYIYSGNLDEVILRQSRKIYQNKCFRNQYILSVNKIVKKSLPHVIKRNFDANIRVYAQMECDIIKYDKNDIITDLKVNKMITKSSNEDYDTILCSNNTTVVQLYKNDKLNDIKVNDIIAVNIIDISYRTGCNKIIVRGKCFAPNETDNYVYNIPKLSNEDIDDLKNNILPIYNKLLNEQNELINNNLLKSRFNYFKTLLYPYVKDKSALIKTKYNILDFDINGILKIDNRIYASDMQIVKSDKNNNLIINEPAIIFYKKIIFAACKELETIISLSVIYKDQKIFNNHQYLFNYYNNLKFE